MAQVKITQIKSIIDRPEPQKRTIRALGFRKTNQTLIKEGTPQVLGMIKQVAHLLTIENV